MRKTAGIADDPGMNDFSHRPALAIGLTLDTLLERVSADPGRWGFTEAMLQGAGLAAEALREAISAQGIAMAAARSATTRKEEAREAALDALSRFARVAYGDPTVDDADLAGIGLSPRPSGTARPRTPAPAIGLAAEPAVDESVRLRWDRNGNGARAIFQVETSPDGGGWTMVGATSRASLTLRGYAPGVQAWFRVVATNAGRSAKPSVPVAIYGGMAGLRIAA